MESPVRKMLKRNDYNRHKLFRKIKRRRKAAAEQQSKAAEKELKRRLKWTAPKFEDGKDDEYIAGYIPEVNVIGTKKPAQILYDNNTGEYSRASTGDVLTPINMSVSNNPSDWTFLDKNGVMFTPNRNYNNNVITQGREINNLDRLLTFSNLHYNDPILGAPARFAEDWHNDRSSIKAGLNYFDPTGLIGYGIDKGVDLYNEGVRALGLEDGIMAAIAAIPVVGKANKIKNLKPQLEKLLSALRTGDKNKFSKLSSLEWDDVENYILHNYGDRSNEMLDLYGMKYSLSGVPSDNITQNINGKPRLWFHGTEYGGHSTFNSSVQNATIGGESAVGKVKGNFLAGDASNGGKPGGGLVAAENYASRGRYEGADFYYPEYTLPETFVEKLKNKIGLFHPLYIHPINRVGNIVDVHNMHLYEKPIIELMRDEYRIPNSDNVFGYPFQRLIVYPLYVNPGKTLEVDFAGKPWSSAPMKYPSKYHVNYDDAVFIPKEGTELGISSTDRIYSNDGGTYNTAEEAVRSVLNKNPDLKSYRSNDYFTGKPEANFKIGYDWYKLRNGETIIPTGQRVIDTAYVNEINYPQTTNGVVLWGASEGYDSVLMKNVVDANTGHKENFAIDDFVPLNSRQMKLAVPTYDNNGARIPISKRFDWTNPDIRYGLLPIGLFGTIGIQQ